MGQIVLPVVLVETLRAVCEFGDAEDVRRGEDGWSVRTVQAVTFCATGCYTDSG